MFKRKVLKSLTRNLIGGGGNKFYRFGIPYYEYLNKVEKGQYHNLVVCELSELGFAVYDIDYVEKMILDLLTVPLTIGEVIKKLENSFEEDVIVNHYSDYQNYIIENIKHLVLYKVVKPYNLIETL